MAQNKITGAVFVSGQTFVAGDEDRLAAHLEGMEPKVRAASVQHLARSGAIQGFGAKAAEIADADPTIAASTPAAEHIVQGPAGEEGGEGAGTRSRRASAKKSSRTSE